jgi:hypothetical protein
MNYKNFIKQVFLPGLLLLSCHLFAQSPGGIANQSIWLKGHFSAGANRSATLNFNPAMALDDVKTPIKLRGNIESLRRATIFTVYQNPGGMEEQPVWEMTGPFGDLMLSTRQVSSKSRKTNFLFADGRTEKPLAVIHTYANCGGAGDETENGEYQETAIRFGNPNPLLKSPPSPGLISELILFETMLDETEMAKVETYLAMKYGITLQKNYLNAAGEMIWNREKNKNYSNNIAGIGRDDETTLLQKQSTSITPGQPIIGIGKIVSSNSMNTSAVNDRDYLLWGDNAGDFTFKQYPVTASSKIMLTEKKWLMKPSGKTAQTLSTELNINAKTLLAGYYPKENFCLVIDRSGTGDFLPDHCSYILPDYISPEGMAVFSKVYWDTDASGKDVFAFGLKPVATGNGMVNGKAPDATKAPGLISFRVYPNPVSDGHYQMAVTLNKPTAVQIQVYDIYQHLVDSKKGSGKSAYLFSGKLNAPAGAYTVKLITPETTMNHMLILQ